MPLSFWFFLGVCIFSFVPVLKDHGESWREYLASTGKEKKLAALLVFSIWAVPIFTAMGTIITGVEAVTSSKENAVLHKLAAEANERSKQLESTNLVLRKHVAELEIKLQPRMITAQQFTNFIFLSEKIRRIPIEINIYAEGRDTETFAMHLRDMLSSAGFGTNEGAGPFGINRKPQFFIGNKPKITNEVPWVYFQTRSTNEVFGVEQVVGEVVNGRVRPIVTELNEPKIFRALEHCFDEIGISSLWMGIPDLAPGKCAILIPIR